MLREGYLARVISLTKEIALTSRRSRVISLPAGLVDLLDLLRMASLDVVEAISLWRLSQVLTEIGWFLYIPSSQLVYQLFALNLASSDSQLQSASFPHRLLSQRRGPRGHMDTMQAC